MLAEIRTLRNFLRFEIPAIGLLGLNDYGCRQ